MSHHTPRIIALALLGVLTLSSCSVIDQLVGETPAEETVTAETDDTTASEEETPDDQGEAPEVVEEEDVVPDCSTMYSNGLISAFTDEGRELEGDLTASGFGWGTVNQDLVAILSDVRADLKVSCTWYLPASESGSSTTIAIIATEQVENIEQALRDEDSTPDALGAGQLWKVDQSSSSISGEFDANEAHFLVSTPCPASLAETDCTLWIASTFSFGSSESLTRDAAEQLGKL